jgi:hypothetical protein
VLLGLRSFMHKVNSFFGAEDATEGVPVGESFALTSNTPIHSVRTEVFSTKQLDGPANGRWCFDFQDSGCHVSSHYLSSSTVCSGGYQN